MLLSRVRTNGQRLHMAHGLADLWWRSLVTAVSAGAQMLKIAPIPAHGPLSLFSSELGRAHELECEHWTVDSLGSSLIPLYVWRFPFPGFQLESRIAVAGSSSHKMLLIYSPKSWINQIRVCFLEVSLSQATNQDALAGCTDSKSYSPYVFSSSQGHSVLCTASRRYLLLLVIWVLLHA